MKKNKDTFLSQYWKTVRSEKACAKAAKILWAGIFVSCDRLLWKRH